HCLNEVLGNYRIHGNNLWYGSSGIKSPEFVKTLDDFLNDKLAQNHLDPVLNFGDSMHCWGVLLFDGKWKQLTMHMVKLSISQHDLHTAYYVYKTLRAAARHTLRNFFKVRHLSGARHV